MNNKLQIKNGDDYKTLEDYWKGMTQANWKERIRGYMQMQ